MVLYVFIVDLKLMLCQRRGQAAIGEVFFIEPIALRICLSFLIINLMSLTAIRRELKKHADPERARDSLRFFKTGPHQYGAGDKFLGIKVPVLRRLARDFRDEPLATSVTLLQSPFHEERLLALFLLVGSYKRGNDVQKKQIYQLYLQNTRFINNWDLVDSSAEHVVGAFLAAKNRRKLITLARSGDLWERRIAMLATFYYIKDRDFTDALSIADLLINDQHDLIHKAVGWMLREIGNRDPVVEKKFLRSRYKKMPRTMLRYAIEKFPAGERQRYLRGNI